MKTGMFSCKKEKRMSGFTNNKISRPCLESIIQASDINEEKSLFEEINCASSDSAVWIRRHHYDMLCLCRTNVTYLGFDIKDILFLI